MGPRGRRVTKVGRAPRNVTWRPRKRVQCHETRLRPNLPSPAALTSANPPAPEPGDRGINHLGEDRAQGAAREVDRLQVVDVGHREGQPLYADVLEGLGPLAHRVRVADERRLDPVARDAGRRPRLELALRL